MKNLDLLKAANDLAFDTIAQTGIQVDAATAAKAAELALTDAQYAGFKNAVNAARGTYARAVQQDTQAEAAAKRAAAQAKTAAPEAQLAPTTPAAPASGV